MSHASTDSFAPFSRLPYELRRSIWELALHHPGPEPNACILTPHEMPLGHRTHDPLRVVVTGQASPLMATNSEARNIALHSRTTRDFDPRTHILYLSEKNFVGFAGTICREVPWASEIRHLALELPVANIGRTWLYHSMKHMSGIETISVVFPKGSGEVDVHERVTVPSSGNFCLQKLTDAQLDTLEVNANYPYQTFMGDHMVTWTRTARQHLGIFKRDLDDMLKEHGRGYGPENFWDHSKNESLVRYEARYFQ